MLIWVYFHNVLNYNKDFKNKIENADDELVHKPILQVSRVPSFANKQSIQEKRTKAHIFKHIR